jgi:hypothetical protein
LTALAAEPPVYSGPQPGERLSPLRVIGVYGEFAGQEIDLVAAAGEQTFLFAIVHQPTRLAADLTRALLHYGETRLEDGLFPALILLAADRTEGERHMTEAVGFWNCGLPAGVSLDGGEGPGRYGLNRNVMMTVLVGQQGRVTHNFPLVQPSVTDARVILTAVTDLIGGEIPSTPELDLMKLHSRVLPFQVRLWQDGKPPQDPKLRELVCLVLRAGSDDKSVKRAAEALVEYVGDDATKQKELGSVAKMLTTYRYGASPPIVSALPNQRPLFEAWAEKYFTREFALPR